MAIQTISTKELRENFSAVKQAMAAGQKLLLLYRSKPLAELKPLKQISLKRRRSKARRFSLARMRQWVKDDQLTRRERQRINEILNRLS